MSFTKAVLQMSIDCIKTAREQGVDNWLNGIVTDQVMESAMKAEQENRINGSYQKLANELQKNREVKQE